MEKGLTYLLREKSNNDLIVATYKGNNKFFRNLGFTEVEYIDLKDVEVLKVI